MLSSSKQLAPRVNQLDAAQLDAELLATFKDTLLDSFALFNTRWTTTLEPEMTLLLQLITYRLSLYKTGSSYGLELQNLKYRDESQQGSAMPTEKRDALSLDMHAPLSARQKLLYPMASFGSRWLWARLTIYVMQENWGSEPEVVPPWMSAYRILTSHGAQGSWKKRAWRAIHQLEKVVKVARLANALLFLLNGRYRSPIDRILRMRLVPINSFAARDVSLEFLHRQLLWHSFTEFLLFFVPLLSALPVKRFAAKYLVPKALTLQLAALPPSTCAICFSSSPHYATNPQNAMHDVALLERFRVSVPYRANCGCVYCYYCLQQKMSENPGEFLSANGGKVPTYTSSPGPQTNRSCRDIFFLILFLLFWVGMFAIAGVAISKGDINRLRYGTDSLNNTCGVMNPAVGSVPAFDATSMPYLLYLDIGMTATPYKRCVSACPSQGQVVCRYNTAVSSSPSEAAAQFLNRSCVATLFDESSVLYRCMPQQVIANMINSTAYSNTTAGQIVDFVSNDLNGRQNANKIFASLLETWQIILGMAIFAMAVSFVWLLLVNVFSGLLVWATVLFANLGVGALAGFMFYNWYQIKHAGQVIYTGNNSIDSQVYNEQTMLALSCIFCALFAIVLLISLAARNRIKLAILVIKETSRAVRAVPSIVVFPVFKYLALCLIFAWFIYIYGLLSTSGTVIAATASADLNHLTQNEAALAKVITPDNVLPFMQIYYIFGLFWSYNWVVAIWQCTIAGSIATWYWTRDKRALPMFTVGKAFWRCFRYHLGSLAFGSLILALVQLAQYLLMEAQAKLKGSNNALAKQVLACLQCVFGCLERFIKFLNKNAYIEIAIYGYSFCEGARHAFELLLRNAFRVVVIDGVATFLLFLGKLLITAVTAIFGLYLLKTYNSDLGSFYAVPLIFIIIEAWMIAAFFTSVVDMAIDTIFLCYCEDCERNDGSAEKPYYMTDSLRAFTSQHKGPQPAQPDIAATVKTKE
ncbi:hypothetical protein RI367_004863 [Sorochytrium milnesiophthora]